MIVICNGMPRSASTWSFNVAARLLREVDGGGVYGGYCEEFTRFLQDVPPGMHGVVKCHSMESKALEMGARGAAKVIYTRRDLADALVSMMNMFGWDFEWSLSNLLRSLRFYRMHRDSGRALIIDYDQIMSSPAQVIESMAAYLGVKSTPRLVAEVAAETSFDRMRQIVRQIDQAPEDAGLVRVMNSAYDPQTLLHKHHIRDGRSGYGRLQLTPEQLRCVDAINGLYGFVAGPAANAT